MCQPLPALAPTNQSSSIWSAGLCVPRRVGWDTAKVPSQAHPCSALLSLLSSIPGPGNSQVWLPAGPEQQVTVLSEKPGYRTGSGRVQCPVRTSVSKVPNKTQATSESDIQSSVKQRHGAISTLTALEGRLGLCILHSGTAAGEGSLQALFRDLSSFSLLRSRVQF